jgi:hypothetical protein
VKDRLCWRRALSRLEPYAAKVSSTVPRGGGGRKAILSPDYLREEYALDAAADYSAVPDDSIREIPNPAWAAADAKLRQAWAQLERLQAEYGLELSNNIESLRRTVRGFKIAHGKLGQSITGAMEQVMLCQKRRDALPRRIPLQELPGEPVMKLAPERKHLTNLLKMVAYQAESDLLRAVAPHYRRADDEGRTLLQSALASAADLDVTATELRVTLAPLSSPHRTRTIAALCEELNQCATLFPGSKLRLHYAVREVSWEKKRTFSNTSMSGVLDSVVWFLWFDA